MYVYMKQQPQIHSQGSYLYSFELISMHYDNIGVY